MTTEQAREKWATPENLRRVARTSAPKTVEDWGYFADQLIAIGKISLHEYVQLEGGRR